jgi:hypothetical protein
MNLGGQTAPGAADRVVIGLVDGGFAAAIVVIR